MNDNQRLQELKRLAKYAQSLVGKRAQSRVLSCITNNGYFQYDIPQEITGFEIVESFGEPTLMVTLGGESVFESTLFNIKDY